jgi:hypothetical protein
MHHVPRLIASLNAPSLAYRRPSDCHSGNDLMLQGKGTQLRDAHVSRFGTLIRNGIRSVFHVLFRLVSVLISNTGLVYPVPQKMTVHHVMIARK